MDFGGINMEKLSYELIGERLKLSREKNKLTQTDVANYLNIKRETISYYETGKRQIDILTLSKFADLYGYSLNHFINNKETNIEETPVLVAFRAENLNVNDMGLVAWGKKFVRNLDSLNNLVKEVG
jgi:transcriptional regulator with XRE-family HTH domain